MGKAGECGKDRILCLRFPAQSACLLADAVPNNKNDNHENQAIRIKHGKSIIWQAVASQKRRAVCISNGKAVFWSQLGTIQVQSLHDGPIPQKRCKALKPDRHDPSQENRPEKGR